MWNKLSKQFRILEIQSFYIISRIWRLVKYDQLHLKKSRSNMAKKDDQALEPVVGNFDALGEATSEEKAPLWGEKNT